MDEQCKQYQLLLMDIHFGERNMDGEIKGHLEKCNDCQAYWQGLDKIEETLDALNFEPAVDYPQISEVLARVRKKGKYFGVPEICPCCYLFTFSICLNRF